MKISSSSSSSDNNNDNFFKSSSVLSQTIQPVMLTHTVPDNLKFLDKHECKFQQIPYLADDRDITNDTKDNETNGSLSTAEVIRVLGIPQTHTNNNNNNSSKKPSPQDRIQQHHKFQASNSNNNSHLLNKRPQSATPFQYGNINHNNNNNYNNSNYNNINASLVNTKTTTPPFTLSTPSPTTTLINQNDSKPMENNNKSSLPFLVENNKLKQKEDKPLNLDRVFQVKFIKKNTNLNFF
jgi:hypothetical protein